MLKMGVKDVDTTNVRSAIQDFFHNILHQYAKCPDCDNEVDMEIGPDDEMAEETTSAKLIEVIEGKENVEKYDKLLSLAITGGDFDWL